MLRSDMRKKLPVYGSRDPPHVLKIMVSQMRTLARIVVLGEFFVDLTHALSKGLPIHCYYGKDRQSDSEAMSCISAYIFQDEFSWNSVGSFVLGFVIWVSVLPWWSMGMCIQERCVTSLFAYYVLLGLQMLSAPRSADAWFHGPSFAALLKLVVHMILRCVSWPEEFGRFLPRWHMERAAELAFSSVHSFFQDKHKASVLYMITVFSYRI